MRDDEEALDRAVLSEFEWGQQFLDREGYPGAALTASRPDAFGIRTYELGGRFSARPDRRSYAVLEVDPGRVGWRFEASLSICLDDRDGCDTVALGSNRTIAPDDAVNWARVLARRAIVGLRDDLERRVESAPMAPG
jgi:hypothetical protein